MLLLPCPICAFVIVFVSCFSFQIPFVASRSNCFIFITSHTPIQKEAVNRSISGLHLYWCLCICICIYLVLSFYINTTPYPLLCVSFPLSLSFSLSLWFPSSSLLVCVCEFYLICLALCLPVFLFVLIFHVSCSVCLSLFSFHSLAFILVFSFMLLSIVARTANRFRGNFTWSTRKATALWFLKCFWPLPCQIWPMACCRYITALSTKVIGAN